MVSLHGLVISVRILSNVPISLGSLSIAVAAVLPSKLDNIGPRRRTIAGARSWRVEDRAGEACWTDHRRGKPMTVVECVGVSVEQYARDHGRGRARLRKYAAELATLASPF